MPINIPQNELLAFVYSTLTGASLVGIDPASGNARSVAVYNQVKQDAPVPYVRISFTDTVNIEDEPFQYDFVPTAERLGLLIDVFSDYEPESYSLASQVRAALQHTEVTTTNFHGSTWLKSIMYFVDNTTNPNRVLRRASIRIVTTLEPRS